MKVGRVQWVRLGPWVAWTLAPSPTSWVALSRALTFSKPQFPHLQMGVMILLKLHNPMEDKTTNKRHVCVCMLSQRTENTVWEAEVHELLQNKWDNDQW